MTSSPLSSATPEYAFTAHRRDPVPGENMLAEYVVDGIIKVSERTAVLQCNDTRLAIKLVRAISDDAQLELRTEQQIHYLLTQLAVARAVIKKPGDAHFTYTGSQDEDDMQQILMGCLRGVLCTANIVPLYDFATRRIAYGTVRMDTASLAASPKHSDLQKFLGDTPEWTSVMVMKRFAMTMFEYVSESKPEKELIVTFHSMLTQAMCTLHMLLAIEFSHGDLRLENLTIQRDTHGPCHYQMFKNVFVHVASSDPLFEMFDFGLSRAVCTDATGHMFRMIPVRELRQGLTESQTFAPFWDIFRLCQLSFLVIVTNMPKDTFAAATIARKKQLMDMIDEPKTKSLFKTFLLAFGRCPAHFLDESILAACTAVGTLIEIDPAKRVDRDFESMLEKVHAVSRSDDAVNEPLVRFKSGVWASSHDRMILDYTLPWDILATLDVLTTTPPEANSADYALHPIVGKGRIYDSRKTAAPGGPDARVHPVPGIWKKTV